MYRNCIFCQRDLGRNKLIESFPVGRRLAFDSKKGRLWVICRVCARWNLTPIEERWEAVDECERTFEVAPRRASTEHIGWSRVDGGLDLIRIGRPLLPEFAAWRYGRQLTRRYKKVVVGTTAAAGGMAALTASIPLGILAAAVFLGPISLVIQAQRARSLVPRVWIRSDSGRLLSVSTIHMPLHALRQSRDRSDWQLEVAHSGGIETLTGTAALHALNRLLPQFNSTGASRSAITGAVTEIARSGSSELFLGRVPGLKPNGWHEANTLAKLPRRTRLGLEIAANEEQERRALDGELAALEQAWRDAEEVAEIADNLLPPVSSG